ncbi:MAG: LUD domain-containing protein [Flavobacteriaceae bacterium]|nr:LUD domain-containing protein [Flavobacteriaceae bacterium]
MTNFWNRIKEIFQPEQDSGEEGMELTFPKEMAPDEKFAKFFSEAGGHFFYCENEAEALGYIKKIIETEHISRLICFDSNLQKMLKSVGANFIDYPSATADFNFLTCENLVAYNGSIVLSSDVMSGRKIAELPDNYIIYANYAQIVGNLSEAMQHLNRTKTHRLPTGITSIGGVDSNPMNEPTAAKNIYLLIVE